MLQSFAKYFRTASNCRSEIPSAIGWYARRLIADGDVATLVVERLERDAGSPAECEWHLEMIKYLGPCKAYVHSSFKTGCQP